MQIHYFNNFTSDVDANILTRLQSIKIISTFSITSRVIKIVTPILCRIKIHPLNFVLFVLRRAVFFWWWLIAYFYFSKNTQNI